MIEPIRMTIWLILWAGMCGVFTQPVAYAQWPQQSCSFPHRIPVTVTAGASGHTGEIRISLTSSDFPASYTLSANGDDIRVFKSDDITPVNFVVSEWNPSAKTATIFVRLLAMSSGAFETLYIYFGDNSVASGGNTSIVFPDIGVRLRSRVSIVDPTSASGALSAFAAATGDVYDAVRTSVSGINNRALGGTNGNYGWCVSAILNVTSATTGVWDFRYGGDFGRGGHLYVRGHELEADWNDDLWWAGNYANTAETLSGSINLPIGWHRYEALGFEGCCDGSTGFQARAPGGTWKDLSSTNFPLRGAQCVNTTVTASIGASQSCGTTLDADKTVSVDSSSPSPYAIPGAIVRYDLSINNPGQPISADTLNLTDSLPPNVAVFVAGGNAFSFTDAAIASGLSFVYSGPASTTDSVEFSTDGVDFSYVPNTPIDTNLSHIRFKPGGVFNPNTANAIPGFKISFLAEVQ